MTETHGTDTVNELIVVKGLQFSSLLTIGAAKWLERKMGKPLMAAAKELVPSDEEHLEIAKLAILITALRIAGSPGIDPQKAESEVDGLELHEMMDVFKRSTPFTFEPKNSPSPATTAQTESIGQSSNTA